MLLYQHSEYLFPSQIALADIENFSSYQQNLIDWIYEYQKKDYGTMISNRGGYQSNSKEIFAESSFSPFKNKIMPCIDELIKQFHIVRPTKVVQMWINVNGKYCYNTSHKHAGVELSGVLWVKQKPESGCFVIENMESGFQNLALVESANYQYTSNKHIISEYVPKYKDGTLCIFPAYLSHRVEMNVTNEDRISISFNIKIL